MRANLGASAMQSIKQKSILLNLAHFIIIRFQTHTPYRKRERVHEGELIPPSAACCQAHAREIQQLHLAINIVHVLYVVSA